MISSQKKTIENYDEMQDEIKSAEKQKNEYIRLSSEYERLIANLSKASNISNDCSHQDKLRKIVDIDKIFHLKAKKKGSTKNLQVMKCEQPSCDAVNVDMIRCNICTKYACEQCQNISGALRLSTPFFTQYR